MQLVAHGGARLTLPHVGSSWRKRTMGGGRGTPVMTDTVEKVLVNIDES
jgi:hypothetical protein